MSTMKRAILAVVAAGAGLAGAEEPSSQRMLQGGDAQKAAALQKRVDDLRVAGKFAEAIAPGEELLALRKRVQGEEHWEAADAARLVRTLRLAAALPADKQASLTQAPGLIGQAAALHNRGKYAEAEPLLRKALAINEDILGPKHPDSALTCNYLANNLQAQHRYREAEALYRKVLAGREEVLGRKHPETNTSRNNLGQNLQEQGRAREAEPLLREALAIWEEVLGPRHHRTALGFTNLAANLHAQGRYTEAEPLFRKALAIWEEGLGARHPRTALGCTNLAANLIRQGRLREAEPLLRKALAVRAEVLGPKHPDTAASCNNLAVHLQVQGRFEEAEPLWHKGAEGKEAARLRLAAGALDKDAALPIDPHLGLAVCRARLGRPLEAWQAAEDGLGRGLLDDVVAFAGLPSDPDRDRRQHDRAARLDAIDRILPPLLLADKLDEADRRRREEFLQERDRLDREAAEDAADRSRKALLSLEAIQNRLDPQRALVFWIDISETGDHWGCVVRRTGPPAWVRLPGSGAQGAWTEADDRLPALLHDDLARGEPDAERHARLLAAQRLEPLAFHLGAGADLPDARHLIVVPVSAMAGVPVEVLSERYRVSYAPSGTLFARLVHRPLTEPTLLALGDPNFALPDAGPPPESPDHGLYLALVLPGGTAARIGLRPGDVLLRYAGVKLVTRDDLKVAEDGERVPVVVWRDGKVRDDLRLAPGKLGVVLSDDPPAVALRKRRERDVLADVRNRGDVSPLLGTRLEVVSLAGLLPGDKVTVLVGSRASEQELDALVASDKLQGFRLLHFATHGRIDLTSARHSALELARDRLPNLDEQSRLAAAGKKVYTGQLLAQTISREWKLDADLVVLSACQTGMGRGGGGEGLMGFSQVLLGRGRAAWSCRCGRWTTRPPLCS